MFKLIRIYRFTNSNLIENHARLRNRLKCSSVTGDDRFTNMPVYKSAISLDQVYSNSGTSPSTPASDADRFNGFIPMDKLEITYAKSSGPGGQNVNKTNTKVSVAFHLDSAGWIPAETRRKLMQMHKSNLTKEGVWRIRSDKTRYQNLNLADCLDKLRCLITEADVPEVVPSLASLEMKRKKAEKAAAERLRVKRHHAMMKNAKKVDI